MATSNTKATTTTKATTGKAAPAPTSVATSNSTAQQQASGQPLGKAVQAALAAANMAQQHNGSGHPLYVVGLWPGCNPTPGSHRHYAMQVACHVQAMLPKGFTLPQFKAALVGAQHATSVPAPKCGWAGHNMPTWAANPKQGWLVPVGSKLAHTGPLPI